MRQFLILSFLIFNNLTYGQLLLSNPDYYVYNNTMDTLYLTKIDVNKTETFWNRPLKSTKVYDTIQIDGIGSKEIIFERTYTGTSEINMQAFHQKTVLQLANMKYGILIQKHCYLKPYMSINLTMSLGNFTIGWLQIVFLIKMDWNIGRCSYKYNFSIDSTGQINIDSITYNNKNNDCIADKREGLYKYMNGKYTYE